jgi:hypothetical protein
VPKGFIPDPYSATVRIGARWRAGKLTTLDDRPLPNIREGSFIELVIPAWAVIDEPDRQRLQSKRVIEMLPTDARVWLGQSGKAVRPELHKKFANGGQGGRPVIYWRKWFCLNRLRSWWMEASGQN